MCRLMPFREVGPWTTQSFFAAVLSIALLLSVQPAQAQPTGAFATGNGNCRAFSVIDQDSFFETANIVSQACDAAFISGSRFGQSIVSVRVLFNATPFADVIAFAEQTDGVPSATRADGRATLTYYSTTDFVDGISPPFIPGNLPLRIAARWAMNVDGASGSNASIRLEILDSDDEVFFSDTQTVGSSAIETDEYVLFGAPEPLDPFTITIESTCNAIAPEEGEADCQAVIDPLLEFDQATFDATWGPLSYPLDVYWELVQSPNLVPEPGVGSMLAWGALALVGATSSVRRRGARRVRSA